jgi:hypothetical protein
MNWKKIFNKPNKIQSEIISEDRRFLHNLVANHIQEKNSEQDKYEENCNSHCPKCGHGHIIDNINTVSINYKTINIPINQCKICGNQWGKYSRVTIKQNDVIYKIKVELYYADDMSTTKIYKSLVDLHAESLYSALNIRCDSLDDLIIPLKELRKYFKSIYDE